MTGGARHPVDLLVHRARRQAGHRHEAGEDADHEARDAPEHDAPDRERRKEEAHRHTGGDAEEEDADQQVRQPAERLRVKV